jgi:hypothetical protein
MPDLSRQIKFAIVPGKPHRYSAKRITESVIWNVGSFPILAQAAENR